MSDDQTAAADDIAETETDDVAETEVVASATVVTDGAYTLFVADFNDTETAWEAYQLLTEVEHRIGPTCSACNRNQAERRVCRNLQKC